MSNHVFFNCISLEVLAEADSQSSGWDQNWDRLSPDSRVPVVWGATRPPED